MSDNWAATQHIQQQRQHHVVQEAEASVRSFGAGLDELLPFDLLGAQGFSMSCWYSILVASKKSACNGGLVNPKVEGHWRRDEPVHSLFLGPLLTQLVEGHLQCRD